MTEIEKKAEEWCVDNMDCCKSENMTNEEINYFPTEERAVAKSAYKDGYEQCQKELAEKADTNHQLVEQMAKLEEENAELKAEIEKMKCCWNCKNFNSECEYCKLDKSLRSFWDDCNKWELAE